MESQPSDCRAVWQELVHVASSLLDDEELVAHVCFADNHSSILKLSSIHNLPKKESYQLQMHNPDDAVQKVSLICARPTKFNSSCNLIQYLCYLEPFERS